MIFPMILKIIFI